MHHVTEKDCGISSFCLYLASCSMDHSVRKHIKWENTGLIIMHLDNPKLESCNRMGSWDIFILFVLYQIVAWIIVWENTGLSIMHLDNTNNMHHVTEKDSGMSSFVLQLYFAVVAWIMVWENTGVAIIFNMRS